jgi:hypothetical protein
MQNCWDFEGATVAVAGLTLLEGVGKGGGKGILNPRRAMLRRRVKLAVPRTDCVDESIAVTVMVVCAPMVLGAE